MTPHERMTLLDKAGNAYVVTFNFLGFPVVKRAEVLSHGERWMEIRHPDQIKNPIPWHINLDLVARLEIEVL